MDWHSPSLSANISGRKRAIQKSYIKELYKRAIQKNVIYSLIIGENWPISTLHSL